MPAIRRDNERVKHLVIPVKIIHQMSWCNLLCETFRGKNTQGKSSSPQSNNSTLKLRASVLPFSSPHSSALPAFSGCWLWYWEHSWHFGEAPQPRRAAFDQCCTQRVHLHMVQRGIALPVPHLLRKDQLTWVMGGFGISKSESHRLRQTYKENETWMRFLAEAEVKSGL